jgi:hypothetical protein
LEPDAQDKVRTPIAVHKKQVSGQDNFIVKTVKYMSGKISSITGEGIAVKSKFLII